MALKWVEGFESYSNLISWVQYRYSSAILGTSTFQPGRAIGNALQFTGTSLITPAFSNQQEWFVGFAFTNVNLGASNVNMPVLEIRDGTTAQITVAFNPSTRVFSVLRGTTVLGTGTFVTTNGAWYYVEINGLIDSAVGVADLLVNTVADVSFSGNTQVSANAYANRMAFKGPAAIGLGGSYKLDDIYINDSTTALNNTFLGDMKVEGVNVIESGQYAQWGVNVPNTPNFQAVQVLNDGLYIQSSTPGEMDAYTTSNLNKITSDIAGVQAVYWARNTDSTTHSIRSLIRQTAVDYLGSGITINDTAFKAYQTIWEEDPATTAAWTVNGVGTAEFGVELQS